MSEPVTYIRRRAEALRTAAATAMNPAVRDDYTSGARYLDLVADELANEFHVSDEDE